MTRERSATSCHLVDAWAREQVRGRTFVSLDETFSWREPLRDLVHFPQRARTTPFLCDFTLYAHYNCSNRRGGPGFTTPVAIQIWGVRQDPCQMMSARKMSAQELLLQLVPASTPVGGVMGGCLRCNA